MLASPLRFASSAFNSTNHADEPGQYRPVKDMEAFNALLPPSIEFVEGSSSGTLAVAEGKYEPVNGSPKQTPQKNKFSPQATSSPLKKAKTSHPSPTAPLRTEKTRSLYTKPIDCSWYPALNVGSGLHNMGNTCFLNSAIQCLSHTPPLLRVVSDHNSKDACEVKSGAFCMVCTLRDVMGEMHRKNARSFTPTAITSKLHLIAKHMRRGRQEDTHEFLRYAIDALQKSCLAGLPPKLDPKIAETTWVHQIFGGRLRSRVKCLECKYNSDTYDRMLDLNVDIHGCGTLREALRRFVAVDHLKGANKYQCEKCKRPVVAEKQFTIHEAPVVLTIHLKRFSPIGKKIGHLVQYGDQIQLSPYVSEGSFGPSYQLYGVICHAGGGPNSGHYYAYVKSAKGQWYEMNDEMVTPCQGAPINKKSAYVLFYIRQQGQGLRAAVSAPTVLGSPSTSPTKDKNGLAAGMKKRKTVGSDDEDTGSTAPVDQPSAEKSGRFIGPLLPSPVVERHTVVVPTSTSTSKAAGLSAPKTPSLKRDYAATRVRPSSALSGLSMYKDDDEDSDEEDIGQDVQQSPEATATQPPRSSPGLPPSSLPSTPSLSQGLEPDTPTKDGAIPASSFYGPSPSNKKRKSTASSEQDENAQPGSDQRAALGPSPNRTPGTPSKSRWKQHGVGRKSALGANPYTRLSGSNNLSDSPKKKFVAQRYGKHRKRAGAV